MAPAGVTGREAAMRVGIIADVHGNLAALEAVLAALAAEGVSRLVCLGDVATGRPPGEFYAELIGG